MASKRNQRVRRPASPRVGLVLGGGGLVGHAYHAGALAALEHDLRWDPRSADVIVGTSAGALTGALIRAGVGASDLAGAFGTLSSLYSDDARRLLGETVLPPMEWRSVLRPRIPNLRLARRVVRTPWLARPWIAALALLHEGRHSAAEIVDTLEDWTGTAWPDGDLRIVAVAMESARRHYFRAADDVRLPQAIAASCAVPGYFEPVFISGRSFVDGGVHSPTNADLLVDDDLDLVIVISPLSMCERPGFSFDGLLRRIASRALRSELAALERGGVPAAVIEPARESARAMGTDFMRPDACSDTMLQGFLDVGRRPGAAMNRLREILRVERAA